MIRLRGSGTAPKPMVWVLAVTINSGQMKQRGAAFAPDASESGQRDFSPRAYFLIRHPQRSQANLVPRGANNDQAKVSLVHSTSQRPVTDVDCPSILPGLGPCWKKWNYWGDKNKKSLSSDSARIPLPGE